MDQSVTSAVDDRVGVGEKSFRTYRGLSICGPDWPGQRGCVGGEFVDREGMSLRITTPICRMETVARVTGGAKPTQSGDEKVQVSMAVSAKMPRLQPWFSVSPLHRVKGSLRRAAPALDPAPRRQKPCPLFWRRRIVSDLRSHSQLALRCSCLRARTVSRSQSRGRSRLGLRP